MLMRRRCSSEPKAAGPRPAVVLLHGMDGPDAWHYPAVARLLANKGYVVFFIRYHDATGTRPAKLSGLYKRFREALAADAAGKPMPADLRATFFAWRDAARAAVDHARKHPKVDPNRVGLVGFSAGGFCVG